MKFKRRELFSRNADCFDHPVKYSVNLYFRKREVDGRVNRRDRTSTVLVQWREGRDKQDVLYD